MIMMNTCPDKEMKNGKAPLNLDDNSEISETISMHPLTNKPSNISQGSSPLSLGNNSSPVVKDSR